MTLLRIPEMTSLCAGRIIFLSHLAFFDSPLCFSGVSDLSQGEETPWEAQVYGDPGVGVDGVGRPGGWERTYTIHIICHVPSSTYFLSFFFFFFSFVMFDVFLFFLLAIGRL